MKPIFFYIMLSLQSSFVFAQDYAISGQIQGLANEEIKLSIFNGSNRHHIDSITTDNVGSFRFVLSSSEPKGMYSLEFVAQESKYAQHTITTHYIDFIFNAESIRIQSHINNINDSISIYGSMENKIYRDFLESKKKFDLKLKLVHNINDNYPENDRYHRMNSRHITGLNRKQNQYIKKINQKNSDLYAAQLIDLHTGIKIPDNIAENNRKLYLKNNFLKQAWFSQANLWNNPILPKRIIEYINLYRNPVLTLNEQEDEYLKAIDRIMLFASQNDTVFNYISGFLLDGFLHTEYNDVAESISERIILNNSCVNNMLSPELLRKANLLHKVSVGQQLPNLTIKSQTDSINLENITADHILLVFWQSNCNYCRQLLDELPDLEMDYYRKFSNHKLEIVSISLDTDEQTYNNYCLEKNMHYLSFCDFEGWNSANVKPFSIYATPTMFLLDKELKIISKPVSAIQLKQEFRTIKHTN